MKRYIILAILIFVTVIFQQSFILELFGPVLTINFVLVYMFAFALNEDMTLAYFTGLIGGLFIDLSGTGIVGLSGFVLILMVWGFSLLRQLFISNYSLHLLLIALFSIVYTLIFSYSSFEFSFNLFAASIFSALLSGIFATIIKRLKRNYLSEEYRIRA